MANSTFRLGWDFTEDGRAVSHRGSRWCHGSEFGASAWSRPLPVWCCGGLPQLFFLQRLEHLPQAGPPFLPERMPCCGRTEQESGPGPRHLVPEGHLAALPRRLGRVPVAYGVTAAPATLASLPSPIVLTPWFVIRWFVIPARGVPLIIIPHRGVIAAMGLQGLQL